MNTPDSKSLSRLRNKESVSRKHSSLTSSLKFHLSEGSDNGDEENSLERIHTFNLKMDTSSVKGSITSINSAKKERKKNTTTSSKIKNLLQVLNLKQQSKKSDLASVSTRLDNLTSTATATTTTGKNGNGTHTR